MPIPAVLAPSSTDATTDHYVMTVKTGTAQMRPGAPTPIVGFNGLYPGPTIVATKGRIVQITQTNGWTENITIHNHGHKVTQASDGHPVDYILPNASKTYTYPNDQRAATYWYHDHTMDLTGAHVYKGIAAFYLIHDPAEDTLNLPSGNFDVPLLIQDKKFNADNTLVYDGSQITAGFLGDTTLVNGVASPHFDVSTHKYRFRVLNGANARTFTLSLKSGKAFQVIGSDGGLLTAPVSLKTLPVNPAERYDIVIDFTQSAVGTTDTLINANQTDSALTNLVEFRVKTSATDTSTVPATLSTITRFKESDVTAQPVPFSFSLASGNWAINGLTFDAARAADVTSHLDTLYIWQLINASGIIHPFHKHLTQFQILDIDGSPPPPEQSGWKDTVALPPGGTVRIIFKDETYPGTFVYHCHNLEHEDHRMMLQEAVVSP